MATSTAVRDFLTKELFINKHPVTFRSLSRQFGIHVNEAKNELVAYYTESHLSDSEELPLAFATYLVSGEVAPRFGGHLLADTGRSDKRERRKRNDGPGNGDRMDVDVDMDGNESGDEGYDDEDNDEGESVAENEDVVPQMKVLLVEGSVLEATKAQFTRIFTVHIYSLSPSPIRDSDFTCFPNDNIHAKDAKSTPTELIAVGKIVGGNVKRRTGPRTSSSKVQTSKDKVLPNAKSTIAAKAPEKKPDVKAAPPDVSTKKQVQSDTKNAQPGTKLGQSGTTAAQSDGKDKTKITDTKSRPGPSEANANAPKPAKPSGKLDWSKAKSKDVAKDSGKEKDKDSDKAKDLDKSEGSGKDKSAKSNKITAKPSTSKLAASTETKRGTKRKSPASDPGSDGSSDGETTMPIPKGKLNAKHAQGPKEEEKEQESDEEMIVRRRVRRSKHAFETLSDDDEDKPRKRRPDEERSLRAMMDIDDDQVIKASSSRLTSSRPRPRPSSRSHDDDDDDDDEQVQGTDADENVDKDDPMLHDAGEESEPGTIPPSIYEDDSDSSTGMGLANAIDAKPAKSRAKKSMGTKAVPAEATKRQGAKSAATGAPAKAKGKAKGKGTDKTAPLGTNGLPKRRVARSRTTVDAKGYMQTEDYSSYESQSEAESAHDNRSMHDAASEPEQEPESEPELRVKGKKTAHRKETGPAQSKEMATKGTLKRKPTVTGIAKEQKEKTSDAPSKKLKEASFVDSAKPPIAKTKSTSNLKKPKEGAKSKETKKGGARPGGLHNFFGPA
ncbi:DNA polymerase subunit Cdc27-domain-containing protein [Hygrophoropsis aurantiaca]|uniref:DNA polymerase subunit Cdc27-domain-containing protein n=1 Tax=Hygrophoropsis aurantiaca TaxID=72124 RepID=A0ACB8A4I1_9AGAM|nr:DNA polymerase subunit Cdc27-domain-containing protein [Hygrophoropsis aurantiaca]